MGVCLKHGIRRYCMFPLNRFSINGQTLLFNKYLTNKSLFISTCTNVSASSSVPLHSYDSYSKKQNLLSKYDLYYQTRDILKRLNYNEFDKFQSDVFNWVRSRYSHTHDPANKQVNFGKQYYEYDSGFNSNVSLVVGGSDSGKTSSYLLALSDVVNDPSNEAFRLNRDNYRSKMMVYGNLKGYKSFSVAGARKINGIPKFNWNSYVVPSAIVLVPFRETGMNIFNLCSKFNIRSRLLAGGKGYKKQAGTIVGFSDDSYGTANNVGSSNGLDRDNIDVLIATPEMFYRGLNGMLDDIKVDIKFIKLMVFEEADLLNEAENLEKINQIINLIYSNRMSLLYVSRFKTEPLLNNLEQFVRLNSPNTTDENSSANGVISSSEGLKLGTISSTAGKNLFNLIEKQVDGTDNVKKIFIHTMNNDRLEMLIDLLHELNVPTGASSQFKISDVSYNCANKTPTSTTNSPLYTHKNYNSLNKNKTVIYCKNKKCNIFLKNSLLDRGFNIINLFGGMNYDERTNNLKSFQSSSNILITTNFTSRFKLDCNINQVILFDFPKDVNEYIHSISSLSGNGKKIYMFFNNKNLSLVKQIQSLSKSFSKFEFRNLTPKLSRKLHLHQTLVLKELKTSKSGVTKKKTKLVGKRAKMANNKSVLGPRKKKLMKKYYLMTKAVKKLEFLRKRGILKRNQLLPNTPDKNVEASDSQEFIQMKRSPDGFLQIIPKRRSRIRSHEETNEYDKESIIIPGAPTYEPKIAKHSTHF